MEYGYARVSTRKQAKDGNSLEAQEKLLKEAGATIIFKESYTGTSKDRPELNKLLNMIKSGDTLLVTKLDRIARSLNQGSILVNELIEKGVTVHILNIGVMNNSPSNKLIRNIFFAFAEFERDMIVERTSEGRYEAVENKGLILGRKPIDKKTLNNVDELINNGYSISKACKIAGIARTTYYNYKNSPSLD